MRAKAPAGGGGAPSPILGGTRPVSHHMQQNGPHQKLAVSPAWRHPNITTPPHGGGGLPRGDFSRGRAGPHQSGNRECSPMRARLWLKARAGAYVSDSPWRYRPKVRARTPNNSSTQYKIWELYAKVAPPGVTSAFFWRLWLETARRWLVAAAHPLWTAFPAAMCMMFPAAFRQSGTPRCS